MADELKVLPEKQPRGDWVQTERKAHEAWAMFLGLPGGVNASRVMHLLIARMGEHNAVVISQATLAELLSVDVRTVRRAVSMLKEHNWIDSVSIGLKGTVNAYVVNDQIAWNGKRDNIRYSLFTANVIVSENEQPEDQRKLDPRELRKLPHMFAGERQLPSGQGLPPVSQPFFTGFEPDLPSAKQPIDRDD